MSNSSIHNLPNEPAVTPEMIEKLGMGKFVLAIPNGEKLPYRQYVSGANLPGKYAMLIFLHGAGSLGHDNYSHVRIPGPPMIDYCNRHNIKAVILFPQCPVDHKWVEVPYDALTHEMPKTPSIYMTSALDLLKKKLKSLNRIPHVYTVAAFQWALMAHGI